MDHLPSSKNSLSSDSSVESIAESTLKTPIDTHPATPLNPSKMPPRMLASRLELVPKRSATAPDSLFPRLSNGHSECTSPHHSEFTNNMEPHHEVRARSHRVRRATNESMSSMASHSSSRSLLRRTLLLVTSSTPSSRPYSALGTPSLLTPRSSVSSLASTSLSSIGAGQAARAASPISVSSSRRARDSDLLTNSPVTSTSLTSLAADPTTALSPTNSNSLAQFSTVPGATSALLQFGVPTRAASQGPSYIARGDGGSRIEARRRRSRDAARRASECEYDDARSASATTTGSLRFKSKSGITFPSAWLGYQASAKNLPSISRVLEPDELGSMDLGDAVYGHITPVPVAGTSTLGLNIPTTWRDQMPAQEQDIAATPRPAFPIESQAQQQQPWLWDSDERAQENGTNKGKGKGKAPAPATAKTVAAHLQAFAPPSLQRSSSTPAPAALVKATRSKTTPIPNLRVAATRMSTQARLSSVVAAPEKKYESNLPSLAAIESGSRLMRAKIICATCGETGPDFPRCGRCGEAWCSRECRVEANRESGGKHRCSPSVA